MSKTETVRLRRYVTCARCGQRKRLCARGLCQGCYSYSRYHGQLDGLDPNPLAVPGTDITYRQLDYWVRQGYLYPTNPQPGSGGGLRQFPANELAVAALMSRLVAAGLTVKAAAVTARAKGSDPWVDLGPGLRLEIRAVAEAE